MSLTDVIIASKTGFLTGIRNLIPYPYTATTKTAYGITWTVNSDGTVTANGTCDSSSDATMDIVYKASSGVLFPLKAGTYTLSGSPQGASNSTYMVRAIAEDGSLDVRDLGSGVTFTAENDIAQLQIRLAVKRNVKVENLVFKPMLECGRVAHDYIPYNFGNADTVDGKHAKEFQRYKDFGDVETDCNNVVENGMYKCRNWLNYPTDHADDQGILEVINYGHGNTEFNATIGKGSMWLRQIFYSPHDNRAWERYVSGTTVSTWTQIGIGAFLPLIGGTLTGDTTIKKVTPTMILEDTASDGRGRMLQTGGVLAIQNINVASDFTTRRQISLYNSTHSTYGDFSKCLKLFEIVNNKTTMYDILHTGNSQKITITADKNTPPSTMEGLWAY